MRNSQRIAKALTIIVAALLLNMLACSKAKFEATEPTNRQTQPSPDNVTTNQLQDPGSGDVVSCGNVNSIFCNNNDDGFQDTVPPLTFTPPYCDIKQPVYGNCYENVFKNSTKNNISGVHIWLVVDSSRSFDQARLAVGRAVANSFLASLKHQVPVTVSVIPAHIASSSYGGASSFNGRIYAQATFRPGMSSSQVSAQENILLAGLDSSMQESPVSLAKRDRYVLDNLNYANGYSGSVLGGPNSGSDEMGLQSFMAAMSYNSIPTNNAWVVMFLADENDVCHNEYGYSHINEREIFEKGHCGGVSASAAYAQAQSFAGNRPFAIGAMTYISQIPSGAHAQSSIGAGYTDIAGMAKTQGRLIDLAAASTQGMQTIANKIVQGLGQVTNNSVGYHTHYPLYYPDGTRVNLQDVDVQSQNGQSVLAVKVYVGPSDSVVSYYSNSKEYYRSDYSYDSTQSLIMPVNKDSVVRIEFCVKDGAY